MIEVQEKNCPICLSDTKAYAYLPCGHIVGILCLLTLFGNSDFLCPLCRGEYTNQPTNPQPEEEPEQEPEEDEEPSFSDSQWIIQYLNTTIVNSRITFSRVLDKFNRFSGEHNSKLILVIILLIVALYLK